MSLFIHMASCDRDRYNLYSYLELLNYRNMFATSFNLTNGLEVFLLFNKMKCKGHWPIFRLIRRKLEVLQVKGDVATKPF